MWIFIFFIFILKRINYKIVHGKLGCHDGGTILHFIIMNRPPGTNIRGSRTEPFSDLLYIFICGVKYSWSDFRWCWVHIPPLPVLIFNICSFLNHHCFYFICFSFFSTTYSLRSIKIDTKFLDTEIKNLY